jgi:hypothetical protein
VKCLHVRRLTLSRGGLVAVAAVLLTGTAGIACADELPARSRKPNIVLILADDLSRVDVYGCLKPDKTEG